MAYPLPTPCQRRILFRLLKQYSSLAAWQHIAQYHRRVVEDFRKIHDDDSACDKRGRPLVSDSAISDLLAGLSSMDAALAALARGDRNTFRYVGFFQRGFPSFWEAGRAVHYWTDGIVEKLFWTRGMAENVDQHPDFPSLEAHLADLQTVLSSGGLVLESRNTDLPAPIHFFGRASGRGVLFGDHWPDPPLPPLAQLPEVPDPPEHVVVTTGQSVPFDGIWEPIAGPSTRWMGLLGQRQTSDAPAHVRGCMNYLQRAARAPSLAFEGDDLRGEGAPTIWRLLWRDDRYSTGNVPAEEVSYQFETPHTVPVEHNPAAPDTPRDLVSGDVVPATGVWRAHDGAGGERATLSAGSRFPPASDGSLAVWTRLQDE